MLSILIPTYNYNILPLVSAVHQQVSKQEISFEIIVMDDASTEQVCDKNELSKLSNTRLIELPDNTGRSSIRNQLAKAAQHPWCLFLDADVLPVHRNFIKTYIGSISEDIDIVNGGILYENSRQDFEHNLRWVYGRKREALTSEQRNKNVYLSFLTLNFLVRKSLFERVRFNETIPNLRHEDTLFSYDLKKHNIRVKHISNPVFHLGLEDSKTFMEKSLKSVDTLNAMVKGGLLPYNYTRISRAYHRLKQLQLHKVFAQLFLWFKNLGERQLLGKRPSLFIFDLYRLGYYCYINKKN